MGFDPCDQRLIFGRVILVLLKIGAHAVAQVLGLADIDDGALLILELVNAGTGWHLPEINGFRDIHSGTILNRIIGASKHLLSFNKHYSFTLLLNSDLPPKSCTNV